MLVTPVTMFSLSTVASEASGAVTVAIPSINPKTTNEPISESPTRTDYKNTVPPVTMDVIATTAANTEHTSIVIPNTSQTTTTAKTTTNRRDVSTAPASTATTTPRDTVIYDGNKYAQAGIHSAYFFVAFFSQLR